MINIIEDISKIVKDDYLYDICLSIESNGIIVYLMEKDNYGNAIPIKFNNDKHDVCIPNQELTSAINAYNVDSIKKIMDYFSEHISELNEICTSFDTHSRHDINVY
nr:hypothetical protein [uncultured Lachnoclostridium sp.]